MQIHSVSHVHGTHAISAPHAAARPESTSAAMRAGSTADVVDISETGRLLEMAAQLPDIRSDRVCAASRYMRKAATTRPRSSIWPLNASWTRSPKAIRPMEVVH